MPTCFRPFLAACMNIQVTSIGESNATLSGSRISEARDHRRGGPTHGANETRAMSSERRGAAAPIATPLGPRRSPSTRQMWAAWSRPSNIHVAVGSSIRCQVAVKVDVTGDLARERERDRDSSSNGCLLFVMRWAGGGGFKYGGHANGAHEPIANAPGRPSLPGKRYCRSRLLSPLLMQSIRRPRSGRTSARPRMNGLFALAVAHGPPAPTRPRPPTDINPLRQWRSATKCNTLPLVQVDTSLSFGCVCGNAYLCTRIGGASHLGLYNYSVEIRHERTRRFCVALRNVCGSIQRPLRRG